MEHSNEQCCVETNSKINGGNVGRVREILGWSDDVSYGIVEITPQMASELLVFNSNNRRLMHSVVEKYTQSILTGQFALSNDAITFDSKGILSNGQHRLHAIVKADKPLITPAMLGVEQSPEMDRGAKRNIIDNVILLGDIEDELRNYHVVKSCKALFDHIRYRQNYNCVELEDFINEYSDEIRLAYNHKLINLHGNVKCLFSANIGAAFLAALITYSKECNGDRKKLNDYLNKLVHIRDVLTSSLATSDEDKIIIYLRNKLTTGITSRGRTMNDLAFRGMQYTIYYYIRGGHKRDYILCTNDYFMNVFKERGAAEAAEAAEAEAIIAEWEAAEAEGLVREA